MQQIWDKPRRPSPVIFLTGLLDAAKESAGYFLIAIISTFLHRKNSTPDNNITDRIPWLILGTFIGVIIIQFQKIFAWFFTRYWIHGDKVVLKKGVLVKKQLELPFQKIQTIQIHQNMVHRLTNTCALTMDTAGSAMAEFVIEAMKTDDARALQQWVRHQQKENNVVLNEIHATPVKSMITLLPKDFLRLCLSENHLKSLALVATFIFAKAFDISQQIGLDSKGFIEEQSSGLAVSMWMATVLLSIALGIAILFSTIRVIIRFYDYRLQYTNTAFEMSWGLFTRHRKTMPYAKIEFFTWWSNWIRQKIGLYILRLHSLSESETEVALQIQLPVTNTQMLGQIAHIYIAEMPADSGTESAGIEKAYVTRKILLVGLPLTLLVGTLAWFYVQWHAAWVLLWVVYYGFSKYAFYKNYKVWMTHDAIQVSRGTWGREQVIIYLNKIVSVSLHTSPFQRKHGYANLELHLPGKSWTIPYLTKEQADYWADYITFKIEV